MVLNDLVTTPSNGGHESVNEMERVHKKMREYYSSLVREFEIARWSSVRKKTNADHF